jgi:hypothetical protein
LADIVRRFRICVSSSSRVVLSAVPFRTEVHPHRRHILLPSYPSLHNLLSSTLTIFVAVGFLALMGF